MSFHFDDFASALRSGGSISANDTRALRQWAWADGVMSQSDAVALFELNALSRAKDPEWIAFFVEALCDYVVKGTEPKDYVSEANASWLIAQLDRDGRVDTAGELELLVTVAEKSLDTANSLKFYALDQIEKIVISGQGPTRYGPPVAACVTAAEARLLRRLVFAAGGDGPARVSRDEADMLFRIKDACIGGDNAPEWQKLFVQGVANHLMAFSSYSPLTRERAAELEAFMRNSSPSIGGFFSRMAKLDVATGLDEIFGQRDAAIDYDAEIAAAEVITSDEKAWLDGKVAGSPGLDAMERTLLAFIAGEEC